MQSSKNLYQGINPHLNSFLQTDGGGWESFHATAIERLTDELEIILPEGYYVLSEKSLQVSTYQPPNEVPSGPTRRTIPDVTVYATRPNVKIEGATIAVPTLTFPVAVAIEEEESITATIIYKLEAGQLPGRPVTRIELLSPANKPGGSHHLTYLARRQETLESGLCMVEIDWLHETPPIVRALPSYPKGTSNAFPYWLIVSDPHPNLAEGRMDVYGTGVHHPLPTIPVPLVARDAVPLNFDRLYQTIFQSRRLYNMVVDYTQPPARFHTYTPADQAIIEQRMAEIIQSQS